MATAPSPNDLTRQQLDELDALLQRMLSLPLPSPEAAPQAPPMPEPPVPIWRVDPPVVAATSSAPHLLLADPPAPSPAAPPAPAPAPRPVSKTAPPLTPAPVSYTPMPVPVPRPAPVSPAPMPVPRPAPVSPAASGLTPVPAAPPVPFVFLPLVVINAAFDARCGMMGGPGKVLRSGFFKFLYGLAGLALLAYTAAHVAQVQGWVALPMSLPWPR